ncbi:MAG: gluconolactonase [Pirellulales bacterium]|nr:gluconolactonase [Pirellulales bacterium]
MPRPLHFQILFAILCIFTCAPLTAEDQPAPEKKGETIALADGQLALVAPADWVRKKPKSNIIEHEFAQPAAEGETIDGRITIMGAGGEVQANIDRWINQFQQPDGSATKEKAKVEKKTIAEMEVHVVDISGTYMDSPAGPFAGGKTVPREDYRMLGAIIIAPKLGNYFIKFYGPAKTVAAGEPGFAKMLETLKVVGN